MLAPLRKVFSRYRFGCTRDLDPAHRFDFTLLPLEVQFHVRNLVSSSISP